MYIGLSIIIFSMMKVNCGTKVKILLIQEENDYLGAIFARTLTSMETSIGGNIMITEKVISLARLDDEPTYQEVCKEFASGVSLMLDFSWTGWKRGKLLAQTAGIPYIKPGITIHPFIRVVDDTLSRLRNATDAVIIFENYLQLEQSLYYLLEFSHLKLLALNGLNSSTIEVIANMLPLPSFLVIIANTDNINKLFSQAMEANLLKKDDRWNLVFTDFNYKIKFNENLLSVSVTKYRLRNQVCCLLAQLPEKCDCPQSFEVTPAFLNLLSKRLGKIFDDLIRNNHYVNPIVTSCRTHNIELSNKLPAYFNEHLLQVNKQPGLCYLPSTSEIYPQLEFQITASPTSISIFLEPKQRPDTKLGVWKSESGLQTEPNIVVKPVKRYFRVGTAVSLPWSHKKIDPDTGEALLDSKGNPVLEGYCIDFIDRLAKDMNFDYDIMLNENFGAKAPDGSWNGLIGDLSEGRIDIAVAAMTMTAEREEVVDFVAPYFEQAGYTILIRKPVAKASLFKFMTVLRLEVWLSILVSLTVTGFLIWFLDKYSPYSAQNNKQLYPYPCRNFTLKESFWFALTSFTPQGGGEAPKSLSGRTLVAAYWLFVVLMLATFTANLAAFLTIERMQSTVQSLEQLAKQSRINYTVVENYDVHRYFQNMKNAEDTLYRIWKQITLDRVNNFKKEYRVWDYPVKEQYGHMLQVIERTGPVPNLSVGVQKVLDSELGEFALIHDSDELSYVISQNCNLTEIGDVFAEQPFAVAVQEGSHISEEISRRILDLQKERYFEMLTAKHWNSSQNGYCPTSDDKGISLESLGGVFIATLCGLAFAVITLAAEIIYYNKNKIKNVSKDDKFDEKICFEILSKKEFGTTVKQRFSVIKPTSISVHPNSHAWGPRPVNRF